MNGKDFVESNWVKEAESSNCQENIKNNFNKWSTRVKNTSLLTRAKQLYEFFLSPDITGSQKTLVAGALLYIISPIDLIPDFIPVIGWLDDIGIASFALSYIFSSMDKMEQEKLLKTEISGTDNIPQFDSTTNQPLNDFNFEKISVQSENLSNKIDELSKIINDLNISEIQDITTPLREKLNENRMLNIIVTGRYSTGKSSLINALLCKNILPAAPTPTTKAITFLTHADKECLYSEQPDGEIIVEQEVQELSNIYNKAIGKAKKVFIALPDFPYSGVTIIDTPGLEDTNTEVSKLTLDAIPEADALIVVLDAGYMQSKVEFEFIDSLMSSDKKRKLFIVINKIDNFMQDKEKMISECKKLLLERGIACENIYALSAKNALNPKGDCADFDKFAKNIKIFLNSDIKAEALRHIDTEITGTANLLIQSCDEAIGYSGIKSQEAKKTKQEAEKLQESITNTYEKQRAIITKKFQSYRAEFFIDFSKFTASLKTMTAEEINKASLETLKNTNNLAEKLKQNISSYIDEKLTEFQEKIQADIDTSKENIRIEIAKLSIPIKISVNDLSTYGNLFLPAVIGTSFIFMGIFTTIGIAIAAVIGRSFFEGAINKFLESLTINKVRAKLITETEMQLDICFKQLQQKLNDGFDAMGSDIEKSYSNALNGAIMPMAIINSPDNNVTISNIRNCRKQLTNILKINEVEK